MARLSLGFCFITLCFLSVGHRPGSMPKLVAAEQLQLTSILPKLDAIHGDTKTLLHKNTELKAKILVGLQAQINARLARETQAINSSSTPSAPSHSPKPISVTSQSLVPTGGATGVDQIDYAELDEFNKWVEVNLEYAIKNTQASIDALKEEAAAQGSGFVDYSEQAIRDGIEGVKYWQSAVIFQDKTLKNEKFDIE